MAAQWSKAVEVALASHPRKVEGAIAYGTAGFRTKAELLDHVMYRMGLLATLRSWAKAGQTIGVMITASHNPECDNGVKLVDPAGEMLEFSWESLATALANAADADIPNQLDSIISKCGISRGEGRVIVGRDTRSSSPALATAVIDGITAVGGQLTDIGVVTTPQLHYMVVATNTKGGYGEASLTGYYKKLTGAFHSWVAGCGDKGKYEGKLLFDGANGVGAPAMKEFAKLLEGTLDVKIFNAGSGVLNSGCGADHVKVSQSCPAGFENTLDAQGAAQKCVSVDGDADRVVYFFKNSAGKFHLLDGDRIATLIAGYLQELLASAGLQDSIKLGLVQTAYANGSSTDYITRELGVPVACAATGVKHLHHKALEYDIGVYFEANGHGTVIFSQQAQKLIKETPGAARLAILMDVVNQTVGDAISDMLVVECVLAARGWSAEDWYACYSDLPNKLTKVSVKDRTMVTTTDAERQVVTPAGLQDRINSTVAQFSKGRSFVRPSGTEDCVRVYAEAATKEEADRLAAAVGDIVKEMLA